MTIHVVAIVAIGVASAFRDVAAPDDPVHVVFYATPAPEPVHERIRERPMPPPPKRAPEPRVEREAPKAPAPLPAPEPVRREEPRVQAPPQAPPKPAPVVRTNLFAASAPVKPERVLEARPTTGGFGNASASAPPGAGQPVLASATTGAFETAVGGGRPAGVVAPGRVASGGFGSAVATSEGRQPSAAREVVRPGGFGDAKTVAPQAAPREVASATPEEPVEILSKPKPVYTEEARGRKIEGEVLLEVMFGASGELRVVRVLRGLGYGLDEAATEAARRVVFRPARLRGRPVDCTATLRVVFQLA